MYEDENGILHPRQEVCKDVNAALQHGGSIPYGSEGMSIGDCLSDGLSLLDVPADDFSEMDEILLLEAEVQDLYRAMRHKEEVF